MDAAFDGLTRANVEANLQNARELFESYLEQVFSEQVGNWETRKLSDCFRLKSGDGLTSNAMIDGSFPVFGGNGIAGMHNASNLSGDNVIVGRVGALCGNARHIKKTIWLTDNAFKLVDFKFDFDNSFLTYLLNYKNLRSLARQAAQPVISNSSLKDLELSFPISKDQQSKISSKLDFMRLECEKLSILSDTKLADLDELRQSLLQKAFAGELT